ncbi:hypothetical protein KK083_09345 [Fulvivirgaceae bacterium PWU4]|uniref:Uncharacterized protein n=1 Tax=Chryseosolibacter histidini TaxID=2782349 RepID=A0AAP2DKN6_9BACT|nr:hypothetical protein [Chryseosolibacter histidini]MBT1697078.1 hypothetical protein [Chryseosolibacter histidini]
MNKVLLYIMALLVVLFFNNASAQQLKRSTSKLTRKTYQYGYALVSGLHGGPCVPPDQGLSLKL